MSAPAPTPWHRLFGIALTDLFVDRPWRVELELELALQSQRLDVLIIERQPERAAAANETLADLPDGLDNLAAHNVLTYKSAEEPLDAWSLDELIGHYVNYRKLTARPAAARHWSRNERPPAPADRPLPPEKDFRLYAVATRYPAGLMRQLTSGARTPTAWEGVYDLTWGARTIRLIVLNRIAPHPRNAPWELFASQVERVRDGLIRYRPRSPSAHLLRYHLAHVHRLEVNDMTYTVEDFKRETLQLFLQGQLRVGREAARALLEDLSAEERLRLLSPADWLRFLPPEERLRGLSPEERLRGLPPEERLRGLPPEERLRGLDPELIKDWLQRTEH